jgi:hypothetical protein
MTKELCKDCGREKSQHSPVEDFPCGHPPSKDLVADLRAAHAEHAATMTFSDQATSLHSMAADEIERLQDALRTAIDSRNAWSYPRTTLEPPVNDAQRPALVYVLRDLKDGIAHHAEDTIWYSGIQTACDRIEEIISALPTPPPGPDAEELEAMRRDAARYEFFREHVGQMCIHTAGDGLAVLVSVNTDLRSVDPGSLDRAIDSAIEREDSTATKGPDHG